MKQFFAQGPNLHYPDETVFSILARQCIRNSQASKSLLSSISGRPKVRIHPFLPCFLNSISNCGFGSPQKLIEQHTLFPLFAFFANKERAQNLRNAMLSDAPLKVAHYSLLSSNHLKLQTALKYCPLCAKIDIETFGVAYWHLSHQIPGINVCANHGVFFLSCTMPNSGWGNLQILPSTNGIIKSATSQEFRLAKFSTKLVKLLTKTDQQLDLASIYKQKMKELGLMTRSGSIRRKKFIGGLTEVYSSLHLFKNDFSTPTKKNFFRLLNIKENTTQHILTHLMFLNWIFSSPVELIKRNEKKQTIKFTSCITSEDKTEKLCLSLLRKGHSINSIYCRIGKSRCYLKRLAKVNGIPITENPRKVSTTTRHKIISLAAKGEKAEVIAKLLSISKAYVEMIISYDVALVEKRRLLKIKSRQMKHRRQLKIYVCTHPEHLRKDIVSNIPNAFHWLYCNDKKWLNEHLPNKTKCHRPQKVNWTQRDSEIHQKLLDNPGQFFPYQSWSEIDRKLGGHGWLTKKRLFLPNSYQLIRSHKSSNSHLSE